MLDVDIDIDRHTTANRILIVTCTWKELMLRCPRTISWCLEMTLMSFRFPSSLSSSPRMGCKVLPSPPHYKYNPNQIFRYIILLFRIAPLGNNNASLTSPVCYLSTLFAVNTNNQVKVFCFQSQKHQTLCGGRMNTCIGHPATCHLQLGQERKQDKPQVARMFFILSYSLRGMFPLFSGPNDNKLGYWQAEGAKNFSSTFNRMRRSWSTWWKLPKIAAWDIFQTQRR